MIIKILFINSFLSFLFIPMSFAVKMQVAQKDLIPQFVSGTYVLQKGEMQNCGDGDFYLRNEDTNLALGYLHGFGLVSATRSVPSPDPEEAGCTEDYASNVEQRPNETVIHRVISTVCAGRAKAKDTADLKIRARTISLAVNAEYLDENRVQQKNSYNCTWQYKAEISKKK